MNGFSSIVAILLAALILFFSPLLYLAEKQDAITQTYVLTETTKFVNKIKNSGCTRKNVYQDFIKKIDKTNNIYNISIEHQHSVVEAAYKDDIFQEDYIEYYQATYEDEILDKIESENIYKLSQGDYITVKVVNRNRTFATKLQSLFMAAEIQTEQINITYGGEIRDEDY